RAQVLACLLNPFHQRVRTSSELTLLRRGRRIRPRGLRRVPIPLPPLQLLRVCGQRRQLSLDGGPTEQLITPLQRILQVVLRLREMLQRLTGRLGVEPLERILELAESLLQLRCDRFLEQLLDVCQAPLERRIVDSRGV